MRLEARMWDHGPGDRPWSADSFSLWKAKVCKGAIPFQNAQTAIGTEC